MDVRDEIRRLVLAIEVLTLRTDRNDEQIEGIKNVMADLASIIADLNTNTNAVAARVDQLGTELAAAQVAGTAPTSDQLASLQAISDHLKALGADPAAPIPAPPPAAVVTPDPSSTPTAAA